MNPSYMDCVKKDAAASMDPPPIGPSFEIGCISKGMSQRRSTMDEVAAAAKRNSVVPKQSTHEMDQSVRKRMQQQAWSAFDRSHERCIPKKQTTTTKKKETKKGSLSTDASYLLEEKKITGKT